MGPDENEVTSLKAGDYVVAFISLPLLPHFRDTLVGNGVLRLLS